MALILILILLDKNSDNKKKTLSDMSDSDSSACSSSNSSVYASGTSSAYPSGSSSACSSGAKLWIGNIDQKIDEYQLLKICEKFGQVTQFDFLYHINDRGDRTPRGYAFVTFGSGTLSIKINTSSLCGVIGTQ